MIRVYGIKTCGSVRKAVKILKENMLIKRPVIKNGEELIIGFNKDLIRELKWSLHLFHSFQIL